MLHVDIRPGLTAAGSIYVSNPTKPDVSAEFREALKEDLWNSLKGDNDLVLVLPPFDFDAAAAGFELAGSYSGHPFSMEVMKPRDAGHHEFHYIIRFDG